MPNRYTGNSKYRYGFNGMESDDEVRGTKGASYDFGARMLDVRIGRWLSGDPLEAKYPMFSTYNYAGNGPIIFIDPNGKEIRVYSDDPKFRAYIVAKLQMLTDDEVVIDSKGFINIVSKSSEPDKFFGTILVRQLINSDNLHLIAPSEVDGDNHSSSMVVDGDADRNGIGTGTLIRIDSETDVIVEDEDGVKRVSPKQIVLGHELIHSAHADLGTMDYSAADDPDGKNYPVGLPSGIPITKEEKSSRVGENVLRKEQKVLHQRKVANENKDEYVMPEFKVIPEDEKK